MTESGGFVVCETAARSIYYYALPLFDKARREEAWATVLQQPSPTPKKTLLATCLVRLRYVSVYVKITCRGGQFNLRTIV